MVEDFIKAKKVIPETKAMNTQVCFKPVFQSMKTEVLPAKSCLSLTQYTFVLPIRGWNRVKNGLKSTGVDERQATQFWSVFG